MASRYEVETREIPGSRRRISSVTVTVDPPTVAPPAADARAVALLRRARECGVTTFDVAGARHPERAERLIATAFPSADPAVGVVVGRSVESLAKERSDSGSPSPSADLPDAVRRSLEASGKRLAPVPIVVVEWEPTEDEGEEGSPITATSFASGDAPDRPVWATRIDPTARAFLATGEPPGLCAGDLSLLDDHLVPFFEGLSAPPNARLLARNPFADGRLDGTRFAATSTLGGPVDGPVDLRRMHAEFDPILRLGFLTEGRRRTLAQAALRFVLTWRWVASAVIPLPEPERFEEVLGFGATPEFSEEERRRLGLVK
jgi:aryl-alcohol dehydrogenase-like predicted oxidoreductase